MSAEQPARPRFGINNLINRMTGHGDEGASHRRHRAARRASPGTPPQSHIPARDEDAPWTRIRNVLKFLRSCGARPTDFGHNRKTRGRFNADPFSFVIRG
jgi:hypothetical protein